MLVFKWLAIAFVVAFLALTAWRWRHQFTGGAGAPAKAIVFDNGTVRATPGAASDPASAPVADAQTPPGTLRKCEIGRAHV